MGVACLLLALPFTINAQNSTCATAATLTLDANCGGTATGAGANTGDPTGFDDTDGNVCSSNYSGGDDFIYIYTATSGDALELSLWATNTWTGIMVTEGCPTTGTCIASATSSSANETVTTPALISGTDYYIHLSTYPTPQSTGQFCLDAALVTPAVPPANDDCAGAFPLTVNADETCTATTAGTVNLATASGDDEAACSGTENDDVWFSFVATSDIHDIELLNLTGGTTDLYHSLWEGSCGALTQIGVCSDPNTSTQTGLTSGSTYYLRVYSWTSSTGQTTAFDVCITTPPPPPSAPANDDCAGAYPLGVNPDEVCSSFTAGTIESATASGVDEAACGGTENDDVWFSFVATSSIHSVELLNLTGGTTDLYHSLWEGSCGALTQIGVCSDPNTSTQSGLTIGSTYYLRVYSWTSTPGQTTSFDACIKTPPPPPVNDDCSGAIVITIPTGTTCPGSTTISTSQATETPIELVSCDGFGNVGVWYQFIAPANGGLEFESIAGSPGLAIFEGPDCDNLTEVPGSCLNNTSGSVAGLTGGATYWAMISTDSPQSVVEFCLYNTPCAAPTFTITVDDTACPAMSISVEVLTLGSATTVDITDGIGTDMEIGVGLGTYVLTGYMVGDPVVTITVADTGDATCNDTDDATLAGACPPDCAAGTEIVCGEFVTTNDLAGSGAWNPDVATSGACYSTPTNETVYRFTPTESGDHIMTIENVSGAGWVDYFYRTDGVCEEANWICISDVLGTTETHTLAGLTAGTEIFIYVDGESSYVDRIHKFHITCPPPPIANAGGIGFCQNAAPAMVDGTNAKVNLLVGGEIIAAINSNGQNLGMTDASYVRYDATDGNTRDYSNAGAGGNGYDLIDRSIVITPTNVPPAPVSVFLYFTDAEYDEIIANSDGDNASASWADLGITKFPTDVCADMTDPQMLDGELVTVLGETAVTGGCEVEI